MTKPFPLPARLEPYREALDAIAQTLTEHILKTISQGPHGPVAVRSSSTSRPRTQRKNLGLSEAE